MNVTKKLKNPPKRLIDHIALVVDASSSMQGQSHNVERVIREQFANIAKLQEDPDRDTYLNYYTFADYVNQHVANTLSGSMAALEKHPYHPYGNTALLDAIGRATNDLSPLDTGHADVSFLIVVITDGEENRSTLENRSSIVQKIAAKNSRGNWTYVYLGPKGSKYFALSLGIPAGNIEEWDATDSREYSRISTMNAGSTVAYTTSRAAGERSTRSYFTTDLSDLTPKTAQQQLYEVSGRYRAITATKETRIDTFVAYHMGRDYVAGDAFYCLTKPEDIQDGKEILLRDKSTKLVYADGAGGVRTTTRSFLGLPLQGEVRVKPGNHANWDIFVQSKSQNRKLVRGTQVLIKK